MKKIICLVLVLLIVVTLCSCGENARAFNKQVFDFQYSFKYAIIQRYDGEQIIELKSWTDYEDGEQLQLTDTDGRVWLVSSYNTILISEAE